MIPVYKRSIPGSCKNLTMDARPALNGKNLSPSWLSILSLECELIQFCKFVWPAGAAHLADQTNLQGFTKVRGRGAAVEFQSTAVMLDTEKAASITVETAPSAIALPSS